MFFSVENCSCVWNDYISCGGSRSYKNGIGWWLWCMLRLLNVQISDSKQHMWNARSLNAWRA
jgi:hypothetical protein